MDLSSGEGQQKLEELLRSSIDKLDVYLDASTKHSIIFDLDHGNHGCAWHELWHLVRKHNWPKPKELIEYEELVRPEELIEYEQQQER